MVLESIVTPLVVKLSAAGSTGGSIAIPGLAEEYINTGTAVWPAPAVPYVVDWNEAATRGYYVSSTGDIIPHFHQVAAMNKHVSDGWGHVAQAKDAVANVVPSAAEAAVVGANFLEFIGEKAQGALDFTQKHFTCSLRGNQECCGGSRVNSGSAGDRISIETRELGMQGAGEQLANDMHEEDNDPRGNRQAFGIIAHFPTDSQYFKADDDTDSATA